MALAVVLAGGGTGGHIFPALALADAIRKREPGVRIQFVGTEGGLETRHVPAAGYPLDLVPSRPVLGKGPLAALRGIISLLRGVVHARRLLRQAQADLVIGVGGSASVPTVTAALLAGVPTALLEPNARAGRANRLLGRFARAVFVQFEEALGYFPRGRAHLLGFPVRAMPRGNSGSSEDVLRLLVLGGSQGARSLNRAITAVLDQLSERDGFRITHQTGAAHFEEVRAAYEQAGVRAELAPFYEDLPERLAQADLVVARAGAATVAELCMTGAPSILVPYPYAADNHQLANARDLERSGACLVIPDAELARRLAPEVRALAADAPRRQRMAEAAAQRARPDAAERIWKLCRSWL
ncbi:MAG: undecaprenyldiphospho-muramoylpentapeptide beta-N-acetylglucosaminyltransferase [Deltaproteobacteria bacterium]|nr:undecaprenyldiphospho-muramoylpentapeptide beta-N-acetylglucosaminyltransferase [Deltaproteobacteria bacterium]